MTHLDFLEQWFLPCLVAKTEVGALSKTLWPALQGGKYTACHPIHLPLVRTQLQHFQSALEHLTQKAPVFISVGTVRLKNSIFGVAKGVTATVGGCGCMS